MCLKICSPTKTKNLQAISLQSKSLQICSPSTIKYLQVISLQSIGLRYFLTLQLVEQSSLMCKMNQIRKIAQILLIENFDQKVKHWFSHIQSGPDDKPAFLLSDACSSCNLYHHASYSCKYYTTQMHLDSPYLCFPYFYHFHSALIDIIVSVHQTFVQSNYHIFWYDQTKMVKSLSLSRIAARKGDHCHLWLHLFKITL